MMAINDFATLSTAIAEWLNRTNSANVVARIPDFIRLAEVDMSKTLRTRYQLVRRRALLNEEIEWLPNDFLQAEAVRLKLNPDDRYKNLEYVHHSQMANLENIEASATPTAYTIFGHAIQFLPPPPIPTQQEIDDGEALEFELIYFARVAFLDATENVVNEILTHYPGIYLYGSLMQAAPYIHDDRQLRNWNDLYERAVAEANSEAIDSLMESVGRSTPSGMAII